MTKTTMARQTTTITNENNNNNNNNNGDDENNDKNDNNDDKATAAATSLQILTFSPSSLQARVTWWTYLTLRSLVSPLPKILFLWCGVVW